MTNERLAELIQEGGNDELLPLLWEKTRVLIYKKCAQFWRCYSEKLERFGYSLDDLRQESYNALNFAVKGYKSEKGYMFTSYLNYALKNVIRGLLSGGSDVLNQTGTMSLEQPLGESVEGDQLLVANVVSDDSAAAEYERIERLDEYSALYEAITRLPPDMRVIIREHYFERLTFKQIGARHDISPDRANQLHNKAIRELRKNRVLVVFFGS